MSEPTNATAGDSFEIGAMVVEKVKIAFFATDTGDGTITLRSHTSILDGWPTILYVRKGKMLAARWGTEEPRWGALPGQSTSSFRFRSR